MLSDLEICKSPGQCKHTFRSANSELKVRLPTR